MLVKPNTNAYTEVARFQAIPNFNLNTNRCWNAPAVSAGQVYVRSTSSAAAFDFSIPALKLDPPQFVAADRLRLTFHTANGAPLDSNRLAALTIRVSTDPLQSLAQWSLLTNGLVLSNGTVQIDNVNAATQPRKFFIVNESK